MTILARFYLVTIFRVFFRICLRAFWMPLVLHAFLKHLIQLQTILCDVSLTDMVLERIMLTLFTFVIEKYIYKSRPDLTVVCETLCKELNGWIPSCLSLNIGKSYIWYVSRIILDTVHLTPMIVLSRLTDDNFNYNK